MTGLGLSCQGANTHFLKSNSWEGGGGGEALHQRRRMQVVAIAAITVDGFFNYLDGRCQVNQPRHSHNPSNKDAIRDTWRTMEQLLLLLLLLLLLPLLLLLSLSLSSLKSMSPLFPQVMPDLPMIGP